MELNKICVNKWEWNIYILVINAWNNRKNIIRKLLYSKTFLFHIFVPIGGIKYIIPWCLSNISCCLETCPLVTQNTVNNNILEFNFFPQLREAKRLSRMAKSRHYSDFVQDVLGKEFECKEKFNSKQLGLNLHEN